MKKGYYSLFGSFQSTISFHVLKLALNESMRAFDGEQGIRKLRPYQRNKTISQNKIKWK